jgi:DUF1680 family protein
MPVRSVLSHTKVDENRGKMALERGPLVYCAEGVDNGGRVLDLVLSDDDELRVERKRDFLGGVVVLRGKALRRSRENDNGGMEQSDLIAIPYCAWSNRGAGEMAVWLGRAAEAEEE